MAEEKWNPRFVEYAAEQGRSPEAQLEHDKEASPGGRMIPFILLSSRKAAAEGKS